ncbi:MAG: LPXTG cell wall anchor domain-containing protein [Bifidobacteriaceae bacterium]|nr:LPXTG cell wall anchor domain-containing protein [Bifidobacteriaceae bacterium]
MPRTGLDSALVPLAVGALLLVAVGASLLRRQRLLTG